MSTYTPISSITLGSAISDVTFSGIPQNYTDLILVCNTGFSTNGQDLQCQVNGDTGTNYSLTNMRGNGSATGSSKLNSQNFFYFDYNGVTNALQNVYTINFMNYANTNIFKTVINRASDASRGTEANVGLWRNTNAITSIKLYGSGGNLLSGSTFNLYGIANASITNIAKATGGDSVYTDGTYWYHIFRSSGLFTPTANLTADYLVVAGGGGGGTNRGGGGGAGGMRCTVTATGGGGSLESALSLGAQAYTVTVGAGGAGGLDSTDARGSNGSNSVFSTITSTGGGGGGGNGSSQNAGASGGSGGGARETTGDPTPTGGAGTANQGYAGAAPTNNNGPSSSSGGGGGGGAGEAGNTDATYEGGDGVATSISGTSVTYAGGGGAGSNYATANGGAGGGGNGVTSNQGGNGTSNLGGGGGGGGDSGATRDGGSGGSGIVIVRYSAV